MRLSFLWLFVKEGNYTVYQHIKKSGQQMAEYTQTYNIIPTHVQNVWELPSNYALFVTSAAVYIVSCATVDCLQQL